MLILARFSSTFSMEGARARSGGVEGLAVCAVRGWSGRRPSTPAEGRSPRGSRSGAPKPPRTNGGLAGWPCAVDDDRCRGVPRGRLKRIVLCCVLPKRPSYYHAPRPRPASLRLAACSFRSCIGAVRRKVGCAALIYESRSGCSSFSWSSDIRRFCSACCPPTFMGGMCLGSLHPPRLRLTRRAPAARLRVARSLASARLALLSSYSCRSSAALYATSVAGTGFRGFCFADCRCAHLPAAADGPDRRLAAGDPGWAGRAGGVSRMGFFYGANMAGRSPGRLIADSTCSVYDMATASSMRVWPPIARCRRIGTGLAVTSAPRARYGDRRVRLAGARRCERLRRDGLSGICRARRRSGWTRGAVAPARRHDPTRSRSSWLSS